MKYFSVMILVASTLLTGCATLRAPLPDDSTLLIGSVKLVAKNYDTFGGSTVNGTHTMGIVVSLKEVETGKALTVTSDGNGFFYSDKIAFGVYRITKLYYKNSAGGSWSDLYLNPGNGGSRITVVKNKINNLGRIDWESDANAEANYYTNRGFDETQAWFKKQDAESKWSQIEIWNVTGAR